MSDNEHISTAFEVFILNPSARHFNRLTDQMLNYQDAYIKEETSKTIAEYDQQRNQLGE